MNKFRIKERSRDDISVFFVQKKGILFWHGYTHSDVQYCYCTLEDCKDGLGKHIRKLNSGAYDATITIHEYK